MTLGSILPDAVQRYLEDKNKTVQSEYDKKQLAWALEERLAIQEKRVPDIDKRPEPPVKRMLKISPNISKSQLIIALEEAGAQGVVINASELDMLTNAMKQTAESMMMCFVPLFTTRRHRLIIRRISAWWWRMFLIWHCVLRGLLLSFTVSFRRWRTVCTVVWLFISVRDGGNGFRQLPWRAAPTM